MKIYAGKPPGFVVVIDDEREVGRPLRHRVLHSPDGFRWGYRGSGPHELARCLLWDHLAEEPSAEVVTTFVYRFVVAWGMDEPWRMTEADVAAWLDGFRTFCRPGRVTRAEELAPV